MPGLESKARPENRAPPTKAFTPPVEMMTKAMPPNARGKAVPKPHPPMEGNPSFAWKAEPASPPAMTSSAAIRWEALAPMDEWQEHGDERRTKKPTAGTAAERANTSCFHRVRRRPPPHADISHMPARRTPFVLKDKHEVRAAGKEHGRGLDPCGGLRNGACATEATGGRYGHV